MEDPLIGTCIVQYRILELLGAGGMGDVFLAEQSIPVHRRAALKFIKLGMDTRQVIARFETGREAFGPDKPVHLARSPPSRHLAKTAMVR